MASLLLWTRERRCASPAAAAAAAACGGADLLQPHHAGRPRDAPETGVLAVDRQQPPSRWMCRRRIRRPAPCARPRAAGAAALADSTRVVVEAAAPLWSPRARSGEVARRSGAEKGRGTPPERPVGCCRCWAGRNCCGFHAGFWLIYLKRGMPPFAIFLSPFSEAGISTFSIFKKSTTMAKRWQNQACLILE